MNENFEGQGKRKIPGLYPNKQYSLLNRWLQNPKGVDFSALKDLLEKNLMLRRVHGIGNYEMNIQLIDEVIQNNSFDEKELETLNQKREVFVFHYHENLLEFIKFGLNIADKIDEFYVITKDDDKYTDLKSKLTSPKNKKQEGGERN